ncbi:hypothetical protein J4419_01490 [Candidatus Woesearchaeota archaeon]|nr:hypothetical protein [Candidatus Woesearchaeota archaeon]
MRKAQSISINTIIVAAIALIVLVVLVMVFTGRITLFGKNLDIIQQGQKCALDNGERDWAPECGTGQVQVYGKFSDEAGHEGQACCKKKLE